MEKLLSTSSASVNDLQSVCGSTSSAWSSDTMLAEWDRDELKQK